MRKDAPTTFFLQKVERVFFLTSIFSRGFSGCYGIRAALYKTNLDIDMKLNKAEASKPV